MGETISRESWPKLFDLIKDKDMIPTIEDWQIEKQSFVNIVCKRDLTLRDVAQFFNRTINRINAGKLPSSHYNIPYRAVNDFREHKFDPVPANLESSESDEKAIKYIKDTMPGIKNPAGYLKAPGRREEVIKAVGRQTEQEALREFTSKSDDLEGRASEFKKIFNRRLHNVIMERKVGTDINAKLNFLNEVISSRKSMIEWFDTIMAEEEREAIYYRSLPPYMPTVG